MNAGERRARFRELHEREQLFVMPNPWDVGSARILAAAGFEALATTSAGFAWSLGKLDMVSRGVQQPCCSLADLRIVEIHERVVEQDHLSDRFLNPRESLFSKP